MPLTSTTRATTRQILGAVGRLAWTLGAVVAIPIVLLRFFGWPLPTQVPDWGEVFSTQLQLVDPIVILNVFVCLAWICWMVVVAYIALDIIDVARGVGQRFHRITPIGVLTAKLVGSAVLLVSLLRPQPSSASAARPVPIVQTVELPTPSFAFPDPGTPAGPDTPVTSPAVAPSAPIYVVQRGDNLWDIAENHLGSGFRWTEIHDLNHELIADPGIICMGWELTLPYDADIAAIAPPPTVVEAPVPVPSPPVPPDPLPSVVPEPAADIPAPPPPTAPPADAATRNSDPGPSDAPDPAAAKTTEPSDAPDLAATTESDAGLPSLVAAVPGVSGATVLATGVLLLLRRVQRRRTALGTVARRPIAPLERTLIAAADVPLVCWAGQELAILGEQLTRRHLDADPVAIELSEDYGLELLWDRPFPDAPAPWEAVPGAWAWRLLYDPDAPIPIAERPAVIPGLVTFGRRHGRQLLIDLEALGSLSVSGDPTPVDDFIRAIAFELGTSEDLADTYLAATAAVVDPDTAAALPRIDIVDPAEIGDRLAAGAAATAASLAEIHARSTFAFRLHDTPVLPLDVNITLSATADDDPDDLIEHAQPRRGVAAILIGPAERAAAHLTIEADGTARLEPLGLTFEAAGLPGSTGAQIIDLLVEEPASSAPDACWADEQVCAFDELRLQTRVDLQGAEPDAPEQRDEDTLIEPLADQPLMSGATVIDLTDAEADGQPDCSSDDWEPLTARMLVRVLGEPTIVGGPQMGRREMIVVTTLACLGRPAHPEDVQEAVWGGEAVVRRTVWNIVTRTRKQLGKWDDEPILHNASRTDGTIRLADGVTTDLQILRSLHDRAQRVSSSEAMPLLRRALELVAGPPFSADGYDWARTNQHASEAEHLIEACAVTLAERALEAGDLDLARFATVHGLRGLPGNETLYRARMRIEDAAGNAAAVRAAFAELTSYLRDFDADPSPESVALYEYLNSTTTSRGFP